MQGLSLAQMRDAMRSDPELDQKMFQVQREEQDGWQDFAAPLPATLLIELLFTGNYRVLQGTDPAAERPVIATVLVSLTTLSLPFVGYFGLTTEPPSIPEGFLPTLVQEYVPAGQLWAIVPLPVLPLPTDATEEQVQELLHILPLADRLVALEVETELLRGEMERTPLAVVNGSSKNKVAVAAHRARSTRYARLFNVLHRLRRS